MLDPAFVRDHPDLVRAALQQPRRRRRRVLAPLWRRSTSAAAR